MINFNNLKVIGIHKGADKEGNEWNIGTFLKKPIEEFKELINNKNNSKYNINNVNIMNSNPNNNMMNNNNENIMNNSLDNMNQNFNNMMNNNNINNLNMNFNNYNNYNNMNNNMILNNNFQNMNNIISNNSNYLNNFNNPMNNNSFDNLNNVNKMNENLNNMNNMNVMNNNLNNMNNMNMMNFNHNNMNNMNMMNANLNNMNNANFYPNNMNNMNFNPNNMNMMNFAPNNINMMDNPNNMNMMNFNHNNMNNMNMMNFTPYNINYSKNNNFNNLEWDEFLFTFILGDNEIKITMKKYKTIELLISTYLNEIGFGYDFFEFIGKDIFFLYNDKEIKKNDYIALLDNKFTENSQIFVKDKKGRINNRILTVKFIINSGNIIRDIKANLNITFEELLKIFLDQFCLSKDVIGKDLFFSHGDKMMEQLYKIKIKDYKNFSGIIKVFDKNSIFNQIVNVNFISIKGWPCVIWAIYNTKMKNIINAFLKIIGLFYEKDILSKFGFIYREKGINPNSEETLESLTKSVKELMIRIYVVVK